MLDTCALIPARGGSKGVPRKNLMPLAGVPLLAWSIVAAKHCSAFSRVIVSTDDAEIAEVARRYGAEVPFMRPAELAQDRTPDRPYVVHALDELRASGEEPQAVAILRPTTPVRDPELLAEAVSAFFARGDATSLRAVHELPEPPQKMMGIENGFLCGLFPHDPRPEYFNLPRQTFPAAYQPNGYVDVVLTDVVRALEEGLFGPRCLAFPTPRAAEVDAIEDIEFLEFVVARGRPRLLDLLAQDQRDQEPAR